MNKGSCSYQAISDWTWVRYMKLCGINGYCHVDCNDTFSECRQDMTIEPGSQYHTLGCIFSFDKQNAELQLLKSDH